MTIKQLMHNIKYCMMGANNVSVMFNQLFGDHCC